MQLRSDIFLVSIINGVHLRDVRHRDDFHRRCCGVFHLHGDHHDVLVRDGQVHDVLERDELVHNALADGALVSDALEHNGRAYGGDQRGAWVVRSAVEEHSATVGGSSREEPSVGAIMGSNREGGYVTLCVI